MLLIQSVLSATKAASELNSFVDSEDFAKLLADVELDAAARAMSNLNQTVDSRSQVWNAVNHLETAYSATRHSMKKKFDAWLTKEGIGLDQEKIRLYQCLLAMCYAFLGEKALCRQALDTAKKSNEIGLRQDGFLWNIPKVLTQLYSAAVIALPVDIYKRFTKQYDKFRVSDDQLNTLEKDLMALLG